MTQGFIYCFSHAVYTPLKLGYTTTSVEKRLSDANSCAFALPYYKIECAKMVQNAKEVEKKMHEFFAEYRETDKREFFNISIDKVKNFFDKESGEDWIEKTKKKDHCMKEYFEDGQQIRPINNRDKIGTYNFSQNLIMYNNKSYKSLTAFVKDVIGLPSVNGWIKCEYLKDGQWRKTKDIDRY